MVQKEDRGSISLFSLFFCCRAHLNDMENIFPFFVLGAIYSLMEPTLSVARLHFLVFFLCRIVHSVAYLCQLKAPTRSVAYVLGQVPCLSMLLQILFAVASHWWLSSAWRGFKDTVAFKTMTSTVSAKGYIACGCFNVSWNTLSTDTMHNVCNVADDGNI